MEEWIRKHRRLLEIEAQAESALLTDKINSLTGKQCESEGLSALSLDITQIRNALFGRCCLTLEKIGKLPLHVGFKVGDEVSLVSMTNEKKAQKSDNEEVELFGLVKQCNPQMIEIVVDDYDDTLLLPPYRLNIRPSLKTHTKMMEALNHLIDSPHPLFSLLHRPSLPQNINLSTYLFQNQIKIDNFINENLNPSQRRAVECCINSSLVGVIHGPPGTGKTSTIIELILQSLIRGEKLLVCAPSNIAVDTILARVASTLEHFSKEQPRGSLVNLKKLGGQIVRLGHPARVSSSIMHYTLDYLISVDARTEIVTDVRKEIDDIRQKLYRNKDKRTKSKRPTDETAEMTRKELRTELKAIQKEVVQREKAVVEGIMKNSRLILATCVGAASHLLKDINFDLVIIDEAAQGLEAACWIPISRGKRCVLAGDHCQLPPTIKSKEAEEGGLSVTLFEKIITDTRFKDITTLLNIQYRMNDLINCWASKNMYGGNVESDDSVMHHTLLDLLPERKAGVDLQAEENNAYTEEIGLPVLMMIDTSNAYMYEDSGSDPSSSVTSRKTTSHRNHHEVDLLVKQVLYLVKKGIKPDNIGIITPYNGQLELLKEAFAPYFSSYNPSTLSSSSANTGGIKIINGEKIVLDGLEIKTIDGFQGGEKECILISFVRSNPGKNVGFLGENRRINVAITRAKRHLTVVCDADTCRADRFIGTLIDHMEEFGEIIPVDFYLSEYLAIHSLPYDANEQSVNRIKETLAELKAKKPESVPAQTSSNTVQKVQGSNSLTQEEKNEKLIQQIREILMKYKQREINGGKVIQKKDSTILFNHLLPIQLSKSSPIEPIQPLQFPVSMSSYLRMQVHEIATELQLYHESTGEGKLRTVSVSLFPFVKQEEGRNDVPKIVDEEKVVESTETLKDLSIVMELANERQDVLTQNDAEVEEHDSTEEIEQVPLTTNVPSSNENKPKKPKKKSKSKKVIAASSVTTDQTAVPLSGLTSLDEDAFLAQQIEQNRRLAELHQYRLASRPMPNYEKEYAKDKLKSKLAEKQDSRKPKIETIADNSNSGSGTSSTRTKKVLKKPVPNFGGGKVGSK